MHKRKGIFGIFIIIFCFLTLCACGKVIPPLDEIRVFGGFSVHYLDVGQGDAIFIRLPDGKNMLIDCGVNDADGDNAEYVIEYLNKYSVNTIDYLILTHPDSDHVGNACEILGRFNVGVAFIPFIIDEMLNLFPEFSLAKEKLEEKQVSIVNPDFYQYIKGENYFFAFLSPSPKTFLDSSYAILASSAVPTATQINNLSPITYLECFGKRFVFTADAESGEESKVISNYKSGFYNVAFQSAGYLVNLENIDCLKVSHHGASDASSKDFLQLLNPKNAIISVGDNFYGHPSSETLISLQEVNPDYNLFRTDVNGTISARLNGQSLVID